MLLAPAARAPRTVLAAGLFAALGTAALAAPVDPSGTWLTGDGRAKIRIDRCGPGGTDACGRVVWLKVPTAPSGGPRTDLNNPDPAKRARPVMGLQIIDRLKPDASGYAGEIYNADEGKMYSVGLKRESESELAVSGCLLKILCGSQTWTRVPDVNQHAANVAPEKAKGDRGGNGDRGVSGDRGVKGDRGDQGDGNASKVGE